MIRSVKNLVVNLVKGINEKLIYQEVPSIQICFK